MRQSYDVVIIGGGVTGTAALFTLSRYTNVRRILFIERRPAVGLVNSNRVNNSQTLHKGPIETNYDLGAARKVKAGADLVEGYIERFAPDICLRIHKMVLGVGDREAESLRRRHAEFAPHFPDIRLLGREELAEIEPHVMTGRDPEEEIVALQEDRGYAVDYQQLAESFVRIARTTDVQIDFVFHNEVTSIEPFGDTDGSYRVRMGGEEVHARAVIVAAGSPSLVFAHSLGYGTEYGMLPVAGSFYRTRDLLNGKVYTVQNPKIPFAAVHGDPAVYDRRETRFGPTAKPMPILERHNYATFLEFMRTSTLTPRGLIAALRVAADWDITRFLLKNATYEIPFIGKRVFLRDVRKICPALEARDLTLDKGAGGIRGQLIDMRTGTIARGKDKLVGRNIIFIMAPSPGASYCLGNALEDAVTFREFFGPTYNFDEGRMRRELALNPTVKKGEFGYTF